MSPKPLETVILVDDSQMDNKLHARTIKRTGLALNIVCFAMAEDAIEYLRQPGAIPADLILLDINMPRMDGFEMLEAAVEEFGEPFLPSIVVMLTTSMDPRDQDRAAQIPVIKDYFQKPLTQEKFVTLVSNLQAGKAA